MSAKTSLTSLLRIRGAAEEEAKVALVKAQDRLLAHEVELAQAAGALSREQLELARVLSTSPIDLGAVALRRAGLAALERRDTALVRMRATLGFEVETRRRALETARAEKRVVEEILARRRAEQAVLERRAETREADDVVATRAANAAAATDAAVSAAAAKGATA